MERLAPLKEAYEKQFNARPQMIVRAPGRVNLIGEHTDYNEGFVFPAAIDREMLIAASSNGTSVVQIYSMEYDATDSFEIGEGGVAITKSAKHTWSDYLRAVIATLQKRGYAVGGFNAVLSGNVPQGAGLSSSAAYEVAAVTLCDKFDQLGISGKDAALIAQQAENEFVGVQCGIMDQFISALGEADSALLIDCRDLSYRPVLLDLSSKGYAIVITHSGVSRGLVDSEYNKRRSQCSEGVKLLSAKLGRPLNSLRDVSAEDFALHEKSLPELVAKRCKHVISENERVLAAVAALEAGDLAAFGRHMNDSHTSLRDDFEVSCPEIDKLVELSQKQPGVLGARITGGGFGGCTVALVAGDAIDGYRDKVIGAYEEATRKKAEVYVCEAVGGARADHLFDDSN